MNIDSLFEEKIIYPLFNGKKDILFQAFFYIDHYNARLFDITPNHLSGPGEIKSCITEIKKRRPDAIIFLRHGTSGQETIKKNIDLTPSNRALGLLGDKEFAYQCGHIISAELSSLGIDIIISDFLGININLENPVIGVRSFADDPKTVSEFAGNYKRGIEDGGLQVVATGFPGKGAISYYHNDKITTYKRDLDSMFMDELIPYLNIIKDGLKMIELSDLYYFHESNTVHEPATLSSSIVEYLRKPLSYTENILSYPIYDDIFSDYDGFNLIKRCLKAGCDLVYLPGRLKENISIMDKLKVQFSSGRLTYDKVSKKIRSYEKESDESLYYIKKKNAAHLERIEENIALRLDRKKFSEMKSIAEPFVVVPKIEDNYFFKSLKYYKRKSHVIEYSCENDEKFFKDTLEKVSGKDVIIVSEGVFGKKDLVDLFLKIIKNAGSCHIIGVGTEYEKDYFLNKAPYFCIGTRLESTYKRVLKEIFRNSY